MIDPEDFAVFRRDTTFIRFYEAAFPDGAESWQQVAEHPECLPRYKGWMAAYLPRLSLLERFAFAKQSDDEKYWCGEIGAYAPELTMEQRHQAAAKSNDPKGWLRYIEHRYSEQPKLH